MRKRSTCFALALALGTTVLSAGVADATGPLSGTKIRSWQTGFVLGAASNSTVGGTVIQYQTDTDQLAQKWAIDPVTTTTFLVHNLNSDMCMNVVGTGANGEIQQRPCDSRWDEQIFSLKDSSKPGRYSIKNDALGKCFQLASTGANSGVYLHTCTPTNAYQVTSFDVR
ncbi:RICIN domain-containing protein [Kitasatospora sp. NPDC097605]|uniref:RICIN domain-containing protein n=1 Tax=Kitasatospora sp. NPDC097605 TaxID=3157226 RepID=UPI003322EE55